MYGSESCTTDKGSVNSNAPANEESFPLSLPKLSYSHSRKDGIFFLKSSISDILEGNVSGKLLLSSRIKFPILGKAEFHLFPLNVNLCKNVELLRNQRFVDHFCGSTENTFP